MNKGQNCPMGIFIKYSINCKIAMLKWNLALRHQFHFSIRGGLRMSSPFPSYSVLPSIAGRLGFSFTVKKKYWRICYTGETGPVPAEGKTTGGGLFCMGTRKSSKVPQKSKPQEGFIYCLNLKIPESISGWQWSPDGQQYSK